MPCMEVRRGVQTEASSQNNKNSNINCNNSTIEKVINIVITVTITVITCSQSIGDGWLLAADQTDKHVGFRVQEV